MNKKLKNMDKKYLGLLLFCPVFIVVTRLLPHLPNFVPVTAIALSAGVYFGRKWALILPLTGLFISDLVIGFYEWPVMLSVYGSFALIGLFSFWLRKNKNAANILGLSVLSSVAFFVITNFAVWAFSPWYAKSLAGLAYCFELALPFFRYTLAGDLFYTAVFFGCFELAYHRDVLGKISVWRKNVNLWLKVIGRFE